MKVSKKQIAEAIKALHAAGYIAWAWTDDMLVGVSNFILDENEDAKDNSIVGLSVQETDSEMDMIRVLDGDRNLTKFYHKELLAAEKEMSWIGEIVAIEDDRALVEIVAANEQKWFPIDKSRHGQIAIGWQGIKIGATLSVSADKNQVVLIW